jgi:hypothetical protein
MIVHPWLWIGFWMCLGGVLSLAVFYALRQQTRFRWRTIDEVGDFMRKPDDGQLAELLRAQEDVPLEDLMRHLFMLRDRRQRRAQLERLKEQYQLRHHNSLVNKDWGNTEWYDMLAHADEGYDASTSAKIQELREAATECCAVLRLALIVIGFWSLVHFLQLDRLRFLSIPEPAALRNIRGTNIEAAYQRLKDAIAAMGTIYTEEDCQGILARM